MKQTNSFMDLKCFTIDPCVKRKMDKKMRVDNVLSNNKFVLSQSNSCLYNIKSQEKVFSIKYDDKNSYITNKFNAKSFNKTNRTNYLSVDFIEGECKADCKNLMLIRNLEFKVKELLTANEQIKKLNEYLLLSINKKEDMYVKISKENFNLKGNMLSNKIHLLNQNLKTQEINKDENSRDNEFPNLTKIKKKCPNAEALSKIVKNLKKTQMEKYKLPNQKIKIEDYPEQNEKTENEKNYKLQDNMLTINSDRGYLKTSKAFRSSLGKFSLHIKSNDYNNNASENKQSLIKDNVNNDIIKIILGDKDKVHKHYDRLSDMVSQFTHRRNSRQTQTISLISDDELEKIILKDYTKLESLLFDDEYIKEIKSSDEKLYALLDSCSKIIKDFQISVRSIKKLKYLIKSGVLLTNSFLQSEEEATSNLIKISCEILDCERTTLFLYDRMQDQLVQCIGIGLEMNQIKIPKNKGIVSSCFNSGERLVINNPYSDKRFCLDFDKTTGYVTKTVLCTPLKDNSGAVIGVIQSLNKRKGVFNSDDQEIQEILAAYGSCMINKSHASKLSDNELTISKLKKLIKFIMKLEGIKNRFELTYELEHLLIEIFHNDIVKFYILGEEENLILRYVKDEIQKMNIIGLIKHVIQTGKLFICKSIHDCPHYNNLGDIQTSYSILTYPLIYRDSKVICGVFQLDYNNLNSISKNLSDTDVYLFRVINLIITDWINNE